MAPIVTEDVRRMVATLPDKLIGVRDRALRLLGFAGAFRRSELVGRRHGVWFLTGGFLIPASALAALRRWVAHGADPPPE